MEYIPAVISLVIFIAMAVIVMRWIMKKSKKDQERFEQEYHKALEQTQKNHRVTKTSSHQ